MPDVDYPAYLRQIGLRLATATYLTTRIAYVLRERFKCPTELLVCKHAIYFFFFQVQTFQGHSLAILQTLFRTAGIAFTDAELSTQNKQMRILTTKTTS